MSDDFDYNDFLPMPEPHDENIDDRVKYLLAPWCNCICRQAPDGTHCKLCGHVH